MNNSCEKVIYTAVTERGERLPNLFRYKDNRRPLRDSINRLIEEKPLEVSLAVATGTLAFGVVATAITNYLLSR